MTGIPPQFTAKFFENIDAENGNNFALHPITFNEVEKQIKLLRNDCSTGFDTIPVQYVKIVSEFLCSPLTSIINNCINKNVFPKLWKIARISPIPKIATPTCSSDYRPIPILSVFSKIFERLILNQLKVFIDSRLIYQITQSGYRKGHSAITLLQKLRDDIQKSFNKSEITMAIIADFSKAFDTVDFGTLIDKLLKLNFGNRFIRLIADYLNERYQFVQIDDQMSDLTKIQYGVPQGSILGPILFNIYVSDLANHTNSSCIQFADDTTFYKHTKVNEISTCAKLMSDDISSIKRYSVESNLIINKKKTKTMLFSTGRMSKIHNLDDPEIYKINLDDNSLERVNEMKLLGVKFDENLCWNGYVQDIIKSSYHTLKVIKKIKRYTPFLLKKQLAEMLILSRIDYGITLYGPNIPVYQIKRLQKVQNAVAGYVLGRYVKEKDIIKLNWLPIRERVSFSISKLAQKALYCNNWPSYLKLNFRTINRNLRSTDELMIERSTNPKTFSYYAEQKFNELPKELRNDMDSKIFAKESKKYYMNKATSRLS